MITDILDMVALLHTNTNVRPEIGVLEALIASHASMPRFLDMPSAIVSFPDTHPSLFFYLLLFLAIPSCGLGCIWTAAPMTTHQPVSQPLSNGLAESSLLIARCDTVVALAH